MEQSDITAAEEKETFQVVSTTVNELKSCR